MPPEANGCESSSMEAIKEWLSKEPRYPHDLSDITIRRFLHSCYGDLDKTKKCMEKFFDKRRNVISKVVTNRDPKSKEIQTAFSITKFCLYKTDEGNSVIVYEIKDPECKNFVMTDLAKCFIMQADQWLNDEEFLEDTDIIIMDCKEITIKMVTKINFVLLKNLIIYFLESVPLRLGQLHFVNCPAFIESIYSMVKMVVPAEIRKIISFHPNLENLYKFVDRKYLPNDLGGSAGPLSEQMDDWIRRIEENREFFTNDELWRLAPKKDKDGKKIDYTTDFEETNNDFSTLCID